MITSAHIYNLAVNIIIPTPHTSADTSEIPKILTIVLGIIGAAALLAVTLGGFRYITAQGDPQKVAQAKNTIIYAVIGVVVIALAEAIVTFVIGNL